MITVISGTNRRNNRTLPISKQIYNLLRDKTVEHVELLNLVDLPLDFIHSGMYKPDGQNKGLKKLHDDFMLKADKFVFVMPEYNGSIPGILKLFIDACSIREYKATFNNKKAALVGVATGRAGNLRGIDHMRGVMSHVGTEIMPAILPISQINNICDKDGLVTDKGTLKTMDDFVNQFIKY